MSKLAYPADVISDIAKKNRNAVAANREADWNDDDLVYAYADKTHFLYELLQNAEDAHAHHVCFLLTSSGLFFEHDGTRLFNGDDVRAICGKGNTTKASDPTAIGKFGIGFKSVFAYTDTPQIHCGEYFFEIQEHHIPEIIEKKSISKGMTTLFYLPFSAGKEEDSAHDIGAGLMKLDGEILLFLTNINKISYFTPEGNRGEIIRKESEGDAHLTIEVTVNDSPRQISHWLRYQKDVTVQFSEKDLLVHRKNSLEMKCHVSIAYHLIEREPAKNSVWEIVPVDGNVSIFFPASNEHSKLRFHIHAPFSCTPARNCLRKEYEPNAQLCRGIADLVVASLYDIRDRGLLKVSFLSVLPNEEDKLEEYYEPIRKKIVTTFKNENLTPTKSGGHAPASKLRTCPSSISDALSDEDMNALLGFPMPVWAANAPKQDSNEYRFLKTLEINVYTWKMLSNHFGDADFCKKLEKHIPNQKNAWLARFYAMAGEMLSNLEEIPYYLYMSMAEIVRSISGKYLKGKDVLLANEDNDIPKSIPIVHPEVLSKGHKQRQFAVEFLKKIGVKEYNEDSFIQMKLGRYKEFTYMPALKTHIADTRKFIKYYQQKGDSICRLFENVCFVLANGPNGESLEKPGSVYWDSPYENTELSFLEECHKRQRISSVYHDKLSPKELEEFLKFLKRLGTMSKVTIKKVDHIDNNPRKTSLLEKEKSINRGYYTTYKDYIIPHFELYIKNVSVLASKKLWFAAIEATKDCLSASYKRTSTSHTYYEESTVVQKFRDTAWVAARDGKFYKPQDMTREMLPENFSYDPNSPMLKAIDFGLKANLQDEEKQRQDTEAKALGFSSRDSAQAFGMLEQEIKDLGGDALSILRSWKSDQEARKNTERSFRDERAPNPEYRRERAREAASSAPAKEYKKLPRSVAVGQDSEAHKEYLRALYSNPSTAEEQPVMTCQMCLETMPFRLPGDGRHYFECHEIFRLDSEHDANHAALCPLCAAKFRYLVRHYDDDLENLKAAVLGADINKDMFSFPVKVAANKTEHIHFKHRHLIDLQSVLSVTAMPDIEEDQE